jgi:hypothetical protein
MLIPLLSFYSCMVALSKIGLEELTKACYVQWWRDTVANSNVPFV